MWAGANLVGAATFGLSLLIWSFPLAFLGMSMMLITGVFGLRKFIKPKRSWYDDALWVLLLIAPAYQLRKMLGGPRSVPESGLIGEALFLIWAAALGWTTWYLWRKGNGPMGGPEFPAPVP